MSATSLLARLGLRLATLGTLANLAYAAPIAEGNVSNSAHTYADRTGWYHPTATSMAFVTDAVERLRLWDDGGVQIGGAFSVSPGANVLRVSANTSGALNTIPVGTRLIITGDAGDSRILAESYGTGVKPAHSGRSARGTNAVPTASQSGDMLCEFGAWGYGATGFSSAPRAMLQLFAAENWTDAAQGTRVGIFTTSPGGVVTTEKVRVWGDGGVTLAGAFAASPGANRLLISTAVSSSAALIQLSSAFTGINNLITASANPNNSYADSLLNQVSNNGTGIRFRLQSSPNGTVLTSYVRGATDGILPTAWQGGVATSGVAAGSLGQFSGASGLNLIAGTTGRISFRTTDASTERAAITNTGIFVFLQAENHAITRVNSNTTLDSTHYTVEVDASGGPITITLPDSTGTDRNGRIYNIKKVDASVNAVTVTRSGADTIDGAVSFSLTVQYQSRTVQARAATPGYAVL